MLGSFQLVNAQNFDWVKRVGGKTNDNGVGIVVDKLGNTYTTGTFSGTVDFDPGKDTFNLTTSSTADMFILKLDSSGNFLWAKNVGGSGTVNGTSVAFDIAGHVYLTGIFRGTADFDPGIGNFNMTSNGAPDMFVLKLDNFGNFKWAKSTSGKNTTSTSIVTDKWGNTYTTGYFVDTTDFDPGKDTFNLVSTKGSDVFITKLDSSGNFVWAKSLEGKELDWGMSIALDDFGNLYATGLFRDTVDFDPGAGSYILTSSNTDMFILKLDTTGSFIWAKATNNTGRWVEGHSIAIDHWGNIYTTGRMNLNGKTANFGPGIKVELAGSIYVAKLDSSGIFLWAKVMGGTTGDQANSLTVDASGNVYTTGYFTGNADFDPGDSTFILSEAVSVFPIGDIFISKLDSSGQFVWAIGMGGNQSDRGNSIALDPSGAIYTTGRFSTTVDFDPELNEFKLTSNGQADVFIHKIKGCISTATLTQTACDRFKLNNESYTSSGIYQQIFTNASGCDSIVTLVLTIHKSYQDTLTIVACDSFVLNEHSYVSSGFYTDTMTTVSGCDSIISVRLTIGHTYMDTLQEIACDRFTFNDRTYTTSGQYTQTLTTVTGCDSSFAINLTIYTIPDTAIIQTGTTLTAVAAGVHYQWVNCDEEYFLINGANAQSFTPVKNGTYAVVITGKGSCDDTSSCYLVSGITAIEELEYGDNIQIYPNPVQDKLMISIKKTIPNSRIRIINLLGQTLWEAELSGTGPFPLEMSSYISGFYTIEISSADKTTRQNIVKNSK